MDNEQRMKTIGGSEIAAVMGVSRWETPLSLWAKKTGKVECEDKSELEYVEIGIDLEDFVAKRFIKKSGLNVRRDNRTFRHKTHDFLVAHIDRRVTGSDEILECKTCSAWKLKEWDGDEIPVEYVMQVIYYLGMLGMKSGYIAVLIGGQRFMYKKIEFDEELYNQMIARAVDFWNNYVLKDVPPMALANDKDIVVELNKNHNDVIIEGDELAFDLMRVRDELDKKIKALEDRKVEFENRLKMYIGDNLGVTSKEYTATWKTQQRTDVDRQKLKDAGLYEEYSKTTDTRVLRIKKTKGE